MLLWFIGISLVITWNIFRDPAIDYRLIVAGSLLPDVIDLPLGGARMMHSVVTAALLLALAMLGTRRRRKLRRRLLAVPIGIFLHLVVDAVWAHTQVFWWPLTGVSFVDRPLPSFDRPWGLVLFQEVAGLAAIVWYWQRFGLNEPTRRSYFLTTGRLVQPAR